MRVDMIKILQKYFWKLRWYIITLRREFIRLEFLTPDIQNPKYLLMKNVSMKKLSLTLLAGLAVTIPSMAGEQVLIDEIAYELNSTDNTAKLIYKVYNFGKLYSGDVVVPPTVTHEGVTYTVTGVGEWCMTDYDTGLKSVVLPETIVTIDNYAFAGIVVPELTIPNSVQTIDNSAFQYSALKSVVLGSGLLSMGDECFYQCPDLTSVTINATVPPTVTSSTFPDDVKANVTLTVPAGCVDTYKEAPGWSGFKAYAEPSLTEDVTVDGIAYTINKTHHTATVRRSDTYSGNIVIPASIAVAGVDYSVTAIDTNAFAILSGVTAVTIPSTVTEIGADAFRLCSGLKNVYISDMTAWAGITFANANSNPVAITGTLTCDGASVTEINIPQGVTEIKDFVFKGLTTLTDVNIPEGVERIGENAFNGCSSLTQVVLPESVTAIGLSAFQNCTSLESINIPGNVTTIPAGFVGGSRITSITVPASVTVIDNQAFRECARLQTIDLSENLSMIYLMVWQGCTDIRTVVSRNPEPPAFFTYQGDATGYGSSFEPSILSTAVLKVPEEAVAAYRGAKGWSNFNNIQPITADNPGIEASVDGYTWLLFDDGHAVVTGAEPCPETIDLPASVSYQDKEYSVTAVGDNAFADTGILSVTLPESVRTIGVRAFAGCPDLMAVALPDNLESIATRAFFDSPRIRYIRCVNTTPPALPESDGGYGEVFATDIWPDCQLVIPVNYFMTYKGKNGWKNFKQWAYWHDYDVEIRQLVASPGEYINRPGESFTLDVSALPANATVTNIVLTNSNPEVAEIVIEKNDAGENVRRVNLLADGETVITVWSGMCRVDCHVTVDSSFDSISGVTTGTEVSGDVYSIDGRLVMRDASAGDVNRLPAGLYIHAGRKIIVK